MWAAEWRAKPLTVKRVSLALSARDRDRDADRGGRPLPSVSKARSVGCANAADGEARSAAFGSACSPRQRSRDIEPEERGVPGVGRIGGDGVGNGCHDCDRCRGVG